MRFDDEIILEVACPFCGEISAVHVSEGDYLRWQNGECAQNAFPYLSTNERELLISGICPTCWDRMFGGN